MSGKLFAWIVGGLFVVMLFLPVIKWLIKTGFAVFLLAVFVLAIIVLYRKMMRGSS